MKRKQLLTKMMLAVAFMGTGSVSTLADPIETIGTTSSAWWTDFSSQYTLSGYGTYHFQFTTTNANDGTVYHTWLLIATDGDYPSSYEGDGNTHTGTEYFVYRGEGYAWGQSTNSNDSEKLSCSTMYSGSNLQDAMNGASVDMYVTRESYNIYVTATVTPTNGDSEFTMSFKYLFANATSDNIGLFLTVENAQVVLNTAEQTSDWSAVWSADFASTPSGLTYAAGGTTTLNISNGYLLYYTSGQNNDRSSTLSFTSSSLQVDTDWILEFDWNSGSANTNASNVAFATNNGTAFTMTWASYATTATVKDASSTTLTSTLPILGYNKSTCSTWSHITIKGDADAGIYLTITNNGITYVDNVLVTSTFGYPSTFNGTLGKNVSSMFVDNIYFYTPTVEDYVAPPTAVVNSAYNDYRTLTLSSLTDGATFKWSTAEYDAENNPYSSWTASTGSVYTDADPIYAIAVSSDGNYTSEVSEIVTGAGSTLTLNIPTITLSGLTVSDGVYNPTYTFTASQSGILGTPTPTITYSFAGGDATEGTSYTAATTGTLTVTATADGYTSAQSSVTVSKVGFIQTDNIDVEDFYGDYASNSNSEWPTGLDYELIPDVTFSPLSNTSGCTYRTYHNPNTYNSLYARNKAFTATCANLTEDKVIVFADYQSNAYNPVTSASNTLTVSQDGSIKYYTLYVQPTLTQSITVSSALWKTLCSPYSLDFTDVSGLKAYIVTGGDGDVLTLEQVNKVPARTGILLSGSATTYNVPVIALSEATDDVSDNKLVGVVAEKSMTAETIYVLMNETSGVGFYLNSNAFTVGANTAYLPSDFAASARGFYSLFGDETTGISAALVNNETMNKEVYNLQGQRVAAPQKGLYVVNGKKVIIK